MIRFIVTALVFFSYGFVAAVIVLGILQLITESLVTNGN